MLAISYTVLPVMAVMIGSIVAVWRRPGDTAISGLQHLAAGVVFAATSVEILPQVMHEKSPGATLLGGALGILVMLSLKALEERVKGPVAMLAAIGVDIFIDGLVLGLAFVAGAQAGRLLAVALTLEVLFLGLTVTTELGEGKMPKGKVLATTFCLSLLLPIGTLVATPVATLSSTTIAGFLSFGVIALLYLVTEELLVEAHEKRDTPFVTALFFIGFLGLLLFEEMSG